MATAVSGNAKNDESMSNADGGRDKSADMAGDGQILQMVDSGFDAERTFESREYQHSMPMLEDPKLKENEMYKKLVLRLSAFFLNTEKMRINGPTERQLETIKKSGFTREYRQTLHKSLREFMINIVNERNYDVKLRQLRKTYEWFFHKLVAMGALSQQEIQ